MSDREEIYSIVFEVILALSLLLFFAVLFVYSVLQSQKKQLINKLKIKELETSREIVRAQSEIQNQTLNYIGNELHDNIGQLLAVARIHLNIIGDAADLNQVGKHATEANSALSQVLESVRQMSKSLDGSYVKEYGLVECLFQELQRVEKTKKYQTTLSVTGTAWSLGGEREIVLFRVMQEFINNTIKHARADHIDISITYNPSHVTLLAKDNGIGFSYDEVVTRNISESGSGIRNIRNRVEMIGGHCSFETGLASGTLLTITVSKADDISNEMR